MAAKKTKKIEDIESQSSHRHHKEWYNLTLAETADKLKVGKAGLRQKSVERRLKRNGHNKLPEKPKTASLVLFLRQFKSSLTYILLAATAISFYFGDHVDAYVILAAVIVNIIVGFIQEYKAQNTLLSLKKIIAHTVWAIRDGKERQINAEELVPGDIVILSSGSRVPADGRLFEADHLTINEAALTGESMAREKSNSALSGELALADRTNMVFAGTTVAEGRGKYFVTRTGVKTELGKIAALVKETKEMQTPLQIKLDKFSRKLGVLVLGLTFLLFLFGAYKTRDFIEMFNIAVAVAVAAIPEGLIVGVTVILAVGMQRILRHGSLVRKLVATETLGSTTVICVDKTGTLTIGEMRVARIVTASHDSAQKTSEDSAPAKSEPELRKMHDIAFYCNNAVLASAEAEESTKKESLLSEVVAGSSTEKALLLSAINALDNTKEAMQERPRFDEIPFNSKKKFMATLHKKTKGQNVVYLKGAPEKILNMVDFYQVGKAKRRLDAKKRGELIKQYESLSGQGLRLLGAAYKNVGPTISSFAELPDYNREAVFVGFWGIKDPLRPEAREAIKITHQAGVRTIMITGDNRHTAAAVAGELGLNPKPSEIIDGADLASLKADELAAAVKKVKVFSRTTPEDKMRIISALQSQGEVVAMTGDGVNDAPALQKADIGLALGSGTDVARDTADIVLLDNNFATIVAAVKQGRIIFDNIKKVILYLLSDSFSEMIIVVVGLLLGWPLVLLPAQILWINLVTDGLPHLALTQEPEEPEIMLEKPQKRGMPILDFERKFLISLISVITAITTLGLFFLIWKTSGDVDRARTVAFVTLGIDSLLYVFSARTVRQTIFSTHFFANKWLVAAVIAGFLVQIVGVYTPFFQRVLRVVAIGASDWILILLACAWVVTAIEIVKYFFIIHRRQESASALKSRGY